MMQTLPKKFKTWLGFSWIGLLGISLWLLSMTTNNPIWAQTDPIDCSFNATIPPASLTLTVTESGPSTFYSITLCTEPKSMVTVRLHVSDSTQEQLIVNLTDPEVYFNQTDWNKPKAIEVSPKNDTTLEPSMTFTIGHSLISDDENFNHPENDVPQVTIMLLDDERGLYLPVVAAQPSPTPAPTPTATPMAQWQQLTTNPPHVDVVAVNNGQLFAGDRSDDTNARGIYRSSACTVNPTFTKAQDNVRIQDFAFTGQVGLAATNGDRVYYTNNGGSSWQRTNSTMNQFAFAVAFTSGPAYAGTDDGIYSSNDNGVTWNKVNPIGNGPNLINVFTYAKEEDLLWIGTYGGGVWKLKPSSSQFTQVIGGLTNVDSDRRVWDILRRSSNEFYIATTNGVYKGNGVGNWSSFGLQGSQVLSLELVGSMLYAGIREGGIKRANLEATATWEPDNSIKANLTVRDLFYDQSGPCKALLAGTTEGIWVYR